MRLLSSVTLRTFSLLTMALLMGVVMASAQTAANSSQPQVGVVSDPCAGMPKPPDASAFRAAIDEAQKKHQPMPQISPELAAAFKNYTAQLLELDFANLCRYAADNAKLPAPTDHRLVMMGDSITENWARMDKKLFTGDVIGRGISGQTTPQMLLRFRADVLDLKPKAVHILAATNDVAGNTGPTSLKRIEDNIIAMAELARAEHVTVILGSVPPAKDFPWRKEISPVEPIEQLNDWMKSYAKANGMVYVDYYSAMVDEAHGMKKELSMDGVHPNDAGYDVMRKLLLQSLPPELKKGIASSE